MGHELVDLLVALHFVPLPPSLENLPIHKLSRRIQHRDNNISNNAAENLVWTDQPR